MSVAPVNMVLHCPACAVIHIDEPHGDWTNPSHKTHQCQACGHEWRPFPYATNGVADIALVIPDLGPEVLEALKAQMRKPHSMGVTIIPNVVGREIAVDLLSSLVAAVSLLTRAEETHRRPSYAAPSARMFFQMMADYERSIERGREALRITGL